MSNTAYTDGQVAYMVECATTMRDRNMDYWPWVIPTVRNKNHTLQSMEDGSIWLVNTNNSVSMRDATKIQLILGAPSK